MSLVLGAALGWFAEVNVSNGLIPVLVGWVVTSALDGEDSQIAHAVVNNGD